MSFFFSEKFDLSLRIFLLAASAILERLLALMLPR
jgi:hypothetical protein